MLATFLFALLPLVSAIVTPTTPDGATVITEGSMIDAAWTADSTGAWTNMTIQLMTGDNLAMVPLKTLASGVDGTTVTTFSTPAPDVEPNSKIYFLQFTNNGNPEATWTTRFTIAAADGTTTEPEQTTNYNGEDVQWGIGAIVGDSTSNSTTPTAGAVSASDSASASASASSTSHSGITNYGPSSTGSPIANPSNGSGPSRASSASASGSSVSDTAASAAASSGGASNGAGKVVAGGLVGVVGVVMALAL